MAASATAAESLAATAARMELAVSMDCEETACEVVFDREDAAETAHAIRAVLSVSADRQALIAALIAAWPDGERFIVVDTRSGQAAALTDDQMDAFRRWFPRPADPQAAEID